MIPSDVTLECDLPSEPVVVVADSTQLLQVLLNLATNAKDAMAGGGILRVSLSADLETRHAVLRVSDTGSGIPPENLSEDIRAILYDQTCRPWHRVGSG